MRLPSIPTSIRDDVLGVLVRGEAVIGYVLKTEEKIAAAFGGPGLLLTADLADLGGLGGTFPFAAAVKAGTAAKCCGSAAGAAASSSGVPAAAVDGSGGRASRAFARAATAAKFSGCGVPAAAVGGSGGGASRGLAWAGTAAKFSGCGVPAAAVGGSGVGVLRGFSTVAEGGGGGSTGGGGEGPINCGARKPKSSEELYRAIQEVKHQAAEDHYQLKRQLSQLAEEAQQANLAKREAILAARIAVGKVSFRMFVALAGLAYGTVYYLKDAAKDEVAKAMREEIAKAVIERDGQSNGRCVSTAFWIWGCPFYHAISAALVCCAKIQVSSLSQVPSVDAFTCE